MIKFFSFILFLFLLFYGFEKINAQTRFQKTYGGGADEVGWSVIQTTDSGYLICGYTTSFGNGGRDAYVIKTDSMGTEMWSKTFGGALNEEATYVLEDNGSYLVGGYTKSYGAGNADAFLARLDASGNILWFKTYGTIADDSHLLRFHKTVDNGIILTYPYKDAGFNSYTLIKTDNNGTLQWQRTYGGTQINLSGDAAQFPDSGYLVNGSTAAYGMGQSDLLVMRTDSLGNIVWNKTLGSSLNEAGAFNITGISNSEVLITGQVDNGLFGLSDVTLIKINYLTGAVSWAAEYGKAAKAFQTYSGAYTQDSGYAMALNDYNTSSPDMRILRTDSAGNILWTRHYGGSGYDAAYGICNTKDNGFALIGYTTSYGAGGADIYFVKTDAGGESSCYEPPDTLQQGVFNYTITSPTIPQVSPADLYNTYTVAATTTGGDSVTDICYRTPVTGCSCPGLGPELIINGDFSLGNTGFSSVYNFATNAFPGLYGITTNAQLPNFGSWSACLDHTTGTGNLMWVDGSDSAVGLAIWNETVAVNPNTNYVFSYWIENVNNFAPSGQVSFTINGVLQGNLVVAPDSACIWVQDCIKWNSGNSTSATISILNEAFFFNGNDFGFDDFSFRECLTGLTSSFVASDTAFCGEAGKCISFTDHSTGNPISWHWLFPGATPDSSFQQNPTNICYYTTGTYPVTLIVTDSTGTDTLTVSPMIIYEPGPSLPVITASGDTVTCPSSIGYLYQWFFNGNLIAGATDSFYVAQTTGTYSLQVTDSLGCSALSNGLYVDITSVKYELAGLSFEIYPNPASQSVVISWQSSVRENIDITVINVLGEKVYDERSEIENQKSEIKIDVSSFVKGVYILHITIGNNSYRTTVVKE